MNLRNRNFLRLTAGTIIAAATLLFGGCNAKPHTIQNLALDTLVSITVYNKKDVEYIDDCFALINEYEQKLSRTIETSEISRLNNREITEISADTAELLAAGLSYSEKTNGIYDIGIAGLTTLWDFTADEPKVPHAFDIEEELRWVDYQAIHLDGTKVTFDNEETQIELGSIAKGFIADKVKELLVSKGVKHAMIDLGGNILLVGNKSEFLFFKEKFDIGITLPYSGGDPFGYVSTSDVSVVTSGTYERGFVENGTWYHHLLDANTGYPCNNSLVGVTIIGPESMHCDALSTTCFSLGLEKGLELINNTPGYYAVFITGDQQKPVLEKFEYHFSEGFEQDLNFNYIK